MRTARSAVLVLQGNLPRYFIFTASPKQKKKHEKKENKQAKRKKIRHLLWANSNELFGLNLLRHRCR